MIRHTTVLLLATFGAAQLSAQQPNGDIPVALGTNVQVQMPGDTVWYAAKITGVGECLTVTRDIDRTSDGFIAHQFMGISALRVTGTAGTWRTMSETQRQQLGACGIGGLASAPAVPPAACGTNAGAARGGIMGFLYGMQTRAGEGGPWEPYAFLTKEEITLITSAAECERILLAVDRARVGQPADSLPLQGIIDLGGLATVVMRGTLPAGPGGHFQSSRALISKELVLRSYERTSY